MFPRQQDNPSAVEHPAPTSTRHKKEQTHVDMKHANDTLL